MLKLLPTLVCLGIILLACDQKSNISSEVDRVVTIQKNIESKSQDSTLIYLKQAQLLLKNIKNAPDSVHAENMFLIGKYFKKSGRADSAAIYFYKAIDYVNDSLYSNRQIEYYKSAWNTHASLGLSGDCLQISNKFKTILREDINYSSYTWAYFWEKSAYLMMGDYKKAHEVLNIQMDFVKRKDTANLPYVVNALASLKYDYLDDKIGAMKMLEKLLEDEETLSNRFKEQTHTNYGVYQYYELNYQKALFHYLKALIASKKDTENSDYLNTVVNAYSNISEVYMDLNNYDMARMYLDSTNQLGIKNMSRTKQKALLNYELRYAIETNKGGKIISKLMDNIYTHQDEIYVQRSKTELQELTKANDKEKLLLAEKQTAEIERIRLKTMSTIGLISAGLLGVIGVLFYQRRKLKFERKSLQNQQRLLRSQMNPHFTFNTLYAIQNEMKKDQKRASDYLLKFSRLLRLILENSTQNYVLLEKELDALRKYMDLQ
ncbi:MAG: histidine kinase, partial [Flavobacteriaceae bacterium]|nr:histidine kinase [Flavobacteriaceae bacterium]